MPDITKQLKRIEAFQYLHALTLIGVIICILLLVFKG